MRKHKNVAKKPIAVCALVLSASLILSPMITYAEATDVPTKPGEIVIVINIPDVLGLFTESQPVVTEDVGRVIEPIPEEPVTEDAVVEEETVNEPVVEEPEPPENNLDSKTEPETETEDDTLYIEETQLDIPEEVVEELPCMPISEDATILSDIPQDYIVACEALRVRTEPNFDSDKVRSIAYGNSFNVIKTITLDDGKTIWGVLEDGYICLYSGRLAHARISFDLENENISDADILARLMIHEAGGEGTDGLVAVAEVVRNRMQSDLFPDTVREVIFQPGQFESVYEIGIVFPTDEALTIANDILDGGEGVLGRDDILYFRNAKTCGADPTHNWGRHKFIVQINHHSFYTQS